MRNGHLIRLKTLKTAALIFALSTIPALAGDYGNVSIKNCTWCHGSSAQGYAPAPRLAGQREWYIVNQLSRFRTHSRDNPFSRMYMWPATANVDPWAARRLAKYFSRLHPQPADDGDRSLVATGRAIYQEGIPNMNIPACVACHGPSAQGIAQIPRLSGLSASYLQRRLQQWHDGYDRTAFHPMPTVGKVLSPRQVAALAAYLSFVK